MFVLLLCDWRVTGMMGAKAGSTCQGSRAALKQNYCYASWPKEVRELPTFYHEDCPQKIHVKSTTGQLWLIILTFIADTNLPPAVSSVFCLSLIYCMEGNSVVLVHFTPVLYNRKAAVHSNTHRSSRLVCLTASLRPVRMSHCWAGGIVPPRRCMHQETVNPPPPSICLRLLFPAKQTTRFPMRAPGPHTASSVEMLYGHHSQMKTVKTPFLKRFVCAEIRFSSIISTKLVVLWISTLIVPVVLLYKRPDSFRRQAIILKFYFNPSPDSCIRSYNTGQVKKSESCCVDISKTVITILIQYGQQVHA